MKDKYYTKRIVAPFLPSLERSQYVQEMCRLAEKVLQKRVHSVYLNPNTDEPSELFSIVIRANINENDLEEYDDTEIVVKSKDLNNSEPVNNYR